MFLLLFIDFDIRVEIILLGNLQIICEYVNFCIPNVAYLIEHARHEYVSAHQEVALELAQVHMVILNKLPDCLQPYTMGVGRRRMQRLETAGESRRLLPA
jgi:hypothetical protein